MFVINRFDIEINNYDAYYLNEVLPLIGYLTHHFSGWIYANIRYDSRGCMQVFSMLHFTTSSIFWKETFNILKLLDK